jgi:exonuclease SbcC
MTSFRLQSITIQDFRSIKGRVTIPLDASIVLVHGVNGAGKTSLLSALELALTGETTGLLGTSGVSRAHLVHRGAEEAQVLLTYETEDGVATGRIRVSNDGATHGGAILSSEDRATFSERCYLAQSTVGRLLEIYQHKVDGQSPLTRFVKELLCRRPRETARRRPRSCPLADMRTAH